MPRTGTKIGERGFYYSRRSSRLEQCSFWHTWHYWHKYIQQVSPIADEPARRAASQQTCYKQRWTLSV